MRHPESPLEALFEAAGDVALHLDCDATITYSCGLDRLPGLSHLAPTGGSFLELFAPESQPVPRDGFAAAMASLQPVTLDAVPTGRLATLLHWRLSGYDARGRRGVMAVARPVGAAREDALRDPLTGLASRLLLQDRCAHAIEIGKRRGTGFAMLLIDLKGLRKVNEALGVATGDELLRGVARRLMANLRASDTVARIGTDEFAVLLPDMADADGMHRLAGKLLALLAAPFPIGDGELHANASMGFALYPSQAVTPGELLLGAAAALKTAKDLGGGRCAMYDSRSRRDARAELSMESALHRGIDAGEFHLDYQPLFDIDGGLYGAEALMRWKRGGTVLVPPAEFIPVVEDCGLIHLLGAWTLKSATASMARINRERDAALTISVNVSPRQFRSPNFVDSVTDALAFSGLSPDCLQLEITESTLMAEPDAAAALLAQLGALGVQVAIDDFGTGYSSLAYLKRFTLSTLKIDRSFVKDLPLAKDLAICRSVFSLSRELGLRSVAEGVETREQWDILRAAGCDAVQGFFFGRPQSIAQFGSLVGGEPPQPPASPSTPGPPRPDAR